MEKRRYPRKMGMKAVDNGVENVDLSPGKGCEYTFVQRCLYTTGGGGTNYIYNFLHFLLVWKHFF